MFDFDIVATNFLQPCLKSSCAASALLYFPLPVTQFSLFFRHLRPSMMQQLLRRLVFDVPMLTEYCKIPLQVGKVFAVSIHSSQYVPPKTIHQPTFKWSLACADPHFWIHCSALMMTSSLSWPSTAADQPLRAKLEVLLPAVRHGQLRHGLGGGAPAH